MGKKKNSESEVSANASLFVAKFSDYLQSFVDHQERLEEKQRIECAFNVEILNTVVTGVNKYLSFDEILSLRKGEKDKLLMKGFLEKAPLGDCFAQYQDETLRRKDMETEMDPDPLARQFVLEFVDQLQQGIDSTNITYEENSKEMRRCQKVVRDVIRCIQMYFTMDAIGAMTKDEVLVEMLFADVKNYKGFGDYDIEAVRRTKERTNKKEVEAGNKGAKDVVGSSHKPEAVGEHEGDHNNRVKEKDRHEKQKEREREREKMEREKEREREKTEREKERKRERVKLEREREMERGREREKAHEKHIGDGDREMLIDQTDKENAAEEEHGRPSQPSQPSHIPSSDVRNLEIEREKALCHKDEEEVVDGGEVGNIKEEEVVKGAKECCSTEDLMFIKKENKQMKEQLMEVKKQLKDLENQVAQIQKNGKETVTKFKSLNKQFSEDVKREIGAVKFDLMAAIGKTSKLLASKHENRVKEAFGGFAERLMAACCLSKVSHQEESPSYTKYENKNKYEKLKLKE